MEVHSDAPQLRASRQIRAQFGDISEVTLWRWLKDEALRFPQPIKISGRNYFRADEIEEFIQRQAERAA